MVHTLQKYIHSREFPPLVKTSVIVTNYNYGFYLDRCLRSLINQSATDYNIIVVNDASDDYSSLILDYWERDPKLHIIRNDQNIGLGPCCNKGILSSRSRYVIRVDADDFVCSDYVLLLSSFLDHSPTFDAVACDYYKVTRDNKHEIIDAMKEPIACGIMFRKEVLFDIGLYTEDPTAREDIDLRDRFDLGKFKMGHIQAPLYRYNLHGNSMTNQMGDKNV